MRSRPPMRPRRVLHLYLAGKQREFRDFSAADRFRWLAAVHRLYWNAASRRRA